jgi:hypothetical protein
MRVARVLAVAATLASAMPAVAAVQVVAPANGAGETGSAVAVTLSAADDAEAAAITLAVNGHDVTPRLRCSGASRSVVLAGVPGRGAALRRGANHLVARAGTSLATATFTWRPGMARVRVVAVGNEIDFDAYATSATWQAEVDRIFTQLVAPRLAAGRPNVVVLTEDFGLPTGLIGSRGATARAAKDQDALTALSNLFVTYFTQANFYATSYTLPGTGLQPLARALTLALTDTLYRNFVPLLQAKAAEYGVYLVACTNIAPAHRSTDPGDVATFGDVDDPARTDAWLPDGIDVYNTAFLWAPDGTLLGTTRKVFLTPPEQDLLNLSNGALDDVQVFDTAAGRLGVAISLDAFVPSYVHHLDDLGAVLVLQPDANPGLWASPPAAIWQPDDWTGSVLGMLQADFPNVTYNATSMMVGNFFPGVLDADGYPTGILFDGQSTITRRSPRPVKRGFVAMSPDLGLTGRFLALAPWAFPDPATVKGARGLAALRAQCGSAVGAGLTPAQLTLAQRRDILRDCARSMLPGGANADGYRENVAVADVVVAVAR